MQIRQTVPRLILLQPPACNAGITMLRNFRLVEVIIYSRNGVPPTFNPLLIWGENWAIQHQQQQQWHLAQLFVMPPPLYGVL